MTPIRDRSQIEHRPVVFLTVLPKERRARHPYQLCIMLAMIHLSAWQLWVGPVPNSAVATLPQYLQDKLNWYALICGVMGIVAAVIPERVVRWNLIRERSFDATWFRLCVELGCHLLVVFVWLSYVITLYNKVGQSAIGSPTGVLAAWLIIAAIARAGQISWTAKQATIDTPPGSGIIGAKELDQ